LLVSKVVATKLKSDTPRLVGLSYLLLVDLISQAGQIFSAGLTMSP
jgi:hypothetical protein